MLIFISVAVFHTLGMKISSMDKYLEKFFEVMDKFKNILLNKILNLTPRERMLLDKMHYEEQERHKSSISYIIVNKNRKLQFHFISNGIIFVYSQWIKMKRKIEKSCWKGLKRRGQYWSF